MNTDELIDSLTEQPASAKKTPKPMMALFTGTLSITVYILLFLIIIGPREDLASRMTDPLFTAEILTSILCIAICVVSISMHGYPDLSVKRWVKYLPYATFAAFALVLVVELLTQPTGNTDYTYGMQCAMEMCLFGLIPPVLFSLILMHGIFIEARHASLTTAILAGVTSYLVLRLLEPVDNMLHYLYWHIIPLVLVIGVTTLLSNLYHKRRKI